MQVNDFLDKLELATQVKTLYVMGCFGSPLTEPNKKRYTRNHDYNAQSSRKNKVLASSPDTFGFDCVNLIKGILWGWSGDLSKTYGGAIYASNGVPDRNADGLFSLCYDQSKDFTAIIPGEMLHMPGHCGVYVGNGLAVECTPKWGDCVQVTAVGNIGKKPGYNTRTWTSHGKLLWIDYFSERSETPADWASEAWEHITAIIGKDGHPIMDGSRPTDNITRQELATVLYRLGLLE